MVPKPGSSGGGCVSPRRRRIRFIRALTKRWSNCACVCAYVRENCLCVPVGGVLEQKEDVPSQNDVGV